MRVISSAIYSNYTANLIQVLQRGGSTQAMTRQSKIPQKLVLDFTTPVTLSDRGTSRVSATNTSQGKRLGEVFQGRGQFL